jgi:hypothetical protein
LFCNRATAQDDALSGDEAAVVKVRVQKSVFRVSEPSKSKKKRGLSRFGKRSLFPI